MLYLSTLAGGLSLSPYCPLPLRAVLSLCPLLVALCWLP